MEQRTGSKFGNEYIKAVYCHPVYLTSMQSTSWEMPGWMKHKLELGLPGEIAITSDMQTEKAMATHSSTLAWKIPWMEEPGGFLSMGSHRVGHDWSGLAAAADMQMTPQSKEKLCFDRKQKETKESLDESERGEWKSWFKTQHSKNTKIMASGPITSWQIDEETMQTVTSFIFLASKVTADGECSHKIKRCLLLGRKAMTNLDSIWKRRDITSPTKVPLVNTMVFPAVINGCESWTQRKLSAKELMQGDRNSQF